MRWLVGFAILIAMAVLVYGIFAHQWVRLADERELGDWILLGPLLIGGIGMLLFLAVCPSQNQKPK